MGEASQGEPHMRPLKALGIQFPSIPHYLLTFLQAYCSVFLVSLKVLIQYTFSFKWNTRNKTNKTKSRYLQQAFMQTFYPDCWYMWLVSYDLNAPHVPAAKMPFQMKVSFSHNSLSLVAQSMWHFSTTSCSFVKLILDNWVAWAAGSGCVFQRQIEFPFAWASEQN